AADSDYVPAKGSITFAPGSTTQTITVLVNGDTKVEGNENFFVTLSNPTAAALSKGRGTCTINNDDQNVILPALSINDITVTEGDGGQTKAVFTLTLSSAVKQTVSVAYTTADGTATVADNDYAADKGVVTFAPGTTTQNVSIAVNGDTKVEQDETFSLLLSD